MAGDDRAYCRPEVRHQDRVLRERRRRDRQTIVVNGDGSEGGGTGGCALPYLVWHIHVSTDANTYSHTYAAAFDKLCRFVLECRKRLESSVSNVRSKPYGH